MKTANRRDFLFGSLALVSGSMLWGCRTLRSGAEGQVQQLDANGLRIRKNVATLTASSPEIVAYSNAVQAMKQLPATDPRSWAAQSQIHVNDCAHANWFFLPWHRAYLHHFESIVRQLSGDSSFALPYWDWTGTPNIPQLFQNTSSPLYASREGTNMDASFIGSRIIGDILSTNDFYTFFSGRSSSKSEASSAGALEMTPHNSVHSRIGAAMSTMTSPADPIFWLHHANVDRLWESWRLRRINQLGAGSDLPPDTNEAAFWRSYTLSGYYTASGQASSMTVNQTLSMNQLGYRYDQLVGSGGGAGLVANVASDAHAHAKGTKLLDTVKDKDETFDLSVTKDNGSTCLVFPQINKLNELLSALMGIPMDDLANASFGLTGESEPTWRLSCRVPVPKQAGAVLKLYLTRGDDDSVANADSPGYVGQLGFFGHNHGSVAVFYDLKRPLIRLLSLGGSNGANGIKLYVRAVNRDGSLGAFAAVEEARLEYIA